MGCDIHVVAEQRAEDTDEWRPAHTQEFCDASSIPAYIMRDYTVFGVLAGVRRPSPNGPIAEPRGLPDDIHEYSKSAFDKVDSGYISHHTSWVTMEEIDERWSELEGSHFAAYVKYVTFAPYYKYRFIFTFDN